MDEDMQNTEMGNCAKKIKLDSGSLKVKIKCTICGADATGCHFRAISCDNCKHFFQRTIIEEKEYKCLVKNESSRHFRLPRPYCEACHYRKCLVAGMYPEAVDAVKARKRKLHHFLQLGLTSNNSNAFSMEPFYLIEELVAAHQLSYKQTDLTECKSNELKLSNQSIFTESTSDLHSEKFDVVANFCKSVPDFLNLAKVFQKCILDNTCFHIMLFRFCTRYFEETRSYVLPNFAQFTSEMIEEELGIDRVWAVQLVAKQIKKFIPPKYYVIMEVYCLVQCGFGYESFSRVAKPMELYLKKLLAIIKNYILREGEISFSCIENVFSHLSYTAEIVKPFRDQMPDAEVTFSEDLMYD